MAFLVKVGKLSNIVANLRSVGRLSLPSTINASHSCRFLKRRSVSEIPTFLSRHLASVADPTVVSATETPLSVTDQQIQILDNQVRQWNRIDLEEVEELMKLLEEKGSVTPEQSLMLLRCTGALLAKVEPAERIKLSQDIWDRLNKLGCTFSIAHHNAALKVQLENGHLFSPTDCLEKLEKDSGVIPNRVTYQLLIARYCEEGDVEGARKVFEYMKSQDMTVNESVFSAFVKGHMKKGDLEGAKEVMRTMGEMNVDISPDTFRVLLSSHAERGDIEAMKETLEEARREELILHARHVYPAVLELARQGHGDKISEYLESCDMRGRGYNHDTLNCMFQLVAAGHDDLAYDMYQRLYTPPDAGQQTGAGRVILRQLVSHERPLSKVLEILDDLHRREVSADNLEYLALVSNKYASPAYTLGILKVMKERNIPVKKHYFWPIFLTETRNNNKEGIYNAVKIMMDLTESTDAALEKTMQSYVVTGLLSLGDDMDTILLKLKELGLSVKSVKGLNIAACIMKGDLAKAVTLCKEDDGSISSSLLKQLLVDGYINSNHDTESLFQLLSEAKVSGQSQAEFNSSVLIGLTKDSRLDRQVLEDIVDQWTQKGLKIYPRFHFPIKKNLVSLGLSEDIINKLEQCVQTGTSYKAALTIEEMERKPAEEIEVMLTERKEKGLGTTRLRKWLLSKYCQSGNVKRVTEIKEELDSEGFVYTAPQLKQLGLMAAVNKKNLEEALEYKNQLETHYPQYSGYTTLVLGIASNQIAQGAIEEAKRSLRDFAEKRETMEDFRDSFLLCKSCEDVLESTQQHCSPEVTREFAELLFDCGYLKKGTFSILNRVMKAYTEKGDLDAIVEAMEYYVRKYQRCPNYSEVFRKFIMLEDADRLQKVKQEIIIDVVVVDLTTIVMREMPVLHHLVAAFVECGKPKQARKILETPGLRALMPILKQYAENYVTSNKTKELQLLCDVTKDVFAIDRDEMLFQLIRAHCRQPNTNYKKAMDIYATYEEENLTPRRRTMTYLAKVLEGAGQDVPFTVPEWQPLPSRKTGISRVTATSPLEKEVLSAVEAYDFEKLLQIRRRSDVGDTKVQAAVVNVVRDLIKRKQHEPCKKLMHDLGEVGDIDTLIMIRQEQLPRALDHFVHQRIFKAYVHSGRGEELLDFLMAHPNAVVKHLTTSGLRLVAEKAPELICKVEALVEKYISQANNTEPLLHLFNYYMLNRQFDKAEDLLSMYSKLKSGLRVFTVCSLAETEGKLKKIAKITPFEIVMCQNKRQGRVFGLNEDVLQKVVEYCRGSSPGRLAMPYSRVIRLKCRDEDWKSALGYVEQAKADGLTIDDLWTPPLVELENLLVKNKQPLPWQEGTMQKRQEEMKRRREESSSNSSSESDSSDDERSTQSRR